VADRVLLRIAAGLLSGLLLAGLAGCAKADLADEGFNGSEVKNAWAVPLTLLEDTEGAAYSFAEQTTKPLTLVFFGYTNCPDICSMVMANITSALTRLDADDQAKVDVVFVTTDPARDDAAALTRYLRAFDDGYTGLTGSLADIEEVAKAFHVFLEKGTKLPSGGYEVVHDDHVFAVNVDDEVPLLWNRDTPPAQLAADLDLLLHP
jgi:protein SCO1